MARKSKKVGTLKKSPPSHIELIDEKTARVKEFSFSHATKILSLQRQTGLGSYTIFNVELYKYDEGSSSIIPIEQQPIPSEGNSIVGDREQ